MKKKTKRQIDALKALITELTERVVSLEKTLGYEYRREWVEEEIKPLIEGAPVPTLRRVKIEPRHVKPRFVKWERYTELPKVEEVQNERETGSEGSSEED